MTVKWQRRTYFLIAVVVATFAIGALTSTAFAKFRGHGANAANFHVTYVGVTDAVDSMPDGQSELVLRQESGRFFGRRRSEMVVDLDKNRIIGLRLRNNRPCDGSGGNNGWCIEVGRQGWTASPLQLLNSVLVGNTLVIWGPAFLQQNSNGDNGSQGMATYRVTLEMPADPAEDGMVLTVNLDGFIQHDRIGGRGRK